MPLGAAVIGLGKIGQGLDYEHEGSSRVLTHATAFFFHPEFQLLAGVDPDVAARARFEKKFSRPAYATLSELVRGTSPDVLAISVPTALHFKVFSEALQFGPRAILCEKPLALTVEEARRMKSMAEAARCVLGVNYMRRFEPGVLELKRRIAGGEFGRIYKGTVWYSKGILNNGSHFIDLLHFLLGSASDVEVLEEGEKNTESDFEPDVRIRFGTANIYFLAGREECFSIREVELMGTSAHVRYARGGEEIVISKTRPSSLFPGYTVLEEYREAETVKTDFGRYQWYVADALHQALASGQPLNSTGATALETMEVIDTILSRRREARHA